MLNCYKGSTNSILNIFKKTYDKNFIIKYLENNFRSNENIIEISKNLIKNNKNRVSKNFTLNKKQSSKTQLLVFENFENEILFVADCIKYFINPKDKRNEKNLSKELSFKFKEVENICKKLIENNFGEDNSKFNYKDIAILCRINKGNFKIIYHLLEKKNIPFRDEDKIKFQENEVINDIIIHLNIILGENYENFEKILHKPKKCGKKLLNYLNSIKVQENL
jgi:DNA helicase II / ATP-dependent DNA helicase PcrA